MMKYLLCLISICSLFWFPFPYTVLLSIITGLFFPPWLLVMGVLADALYLPQGAFPYMSLYGLIGTIPMVFVHRFLKARLITA